MNRKQRIVILIGIIIITIMLLIPPWKNYRVGGYGGVHVGYGFLFDSSYRLHIGLSLERRWPTFLKSEDVYLDISRLFIQCVLVIVVVGGVVFMLHRPE